MKIIIIIIIIIILFLSAGCTKVINIDCSNCNISNGTLVCDSNSDTKCYTGLCDFSYHDGKNLIINSGCCDDWNGTNFVEARK